MKLGDLVMVKLPGIQPYIGLAIRVNDTGGALVCSTDGKFEYWVYEWSSEVVNEYR